MICDLGRGNHGGPVVDDGHVLLVDVEELHGETDGDGGGHLVVDRDSAELSATFAEETIVTGSSTTVVLTQVRCDCLLDNWDRQI